MRHDAAIQEAVTVEAGQPEGRTASICGIACGLAACLWFGGNIFWFKVVAHVPAWEVLAHRIIWSSVLLIAILVVTGRVRAAARALCNRTASITLSVTALLIGTNWFVFIWAVAHDRILETSLAYYISPLIKVFLGCVFIREKLTPAQIVSVILAFTGIAILGLSYGRVPIIALVLSFSDGFYGLLRKKLPVDATTGLAFEAIFLTPAALLFILYLMHYKVLVFAHSTPTTDVLLVAAGIITVGPLVLYCYALKRLPYSSLGLMMYIMPSITFVIAVFVFHEPFGTAQIVTFCCIWASLVIYVYDLLRCSTRVNTFGQIGNERSRGD